MCIEAGDTLWIPVYCDGSLDALIAYQDEPPANGNSLNSWLFVRTDGPEEWTWYAWDQWETPEHIAAFVAGQYTINANAVLDAWPVELDEPAYTQHLAAPTSPLPFSNGVFANDPLEPAVQSNPDLLAPLEAIGYPAASTVSGGFFGAQTPQLPAGGSSCMQVDDVLGVLEATLTPGHHDATAVLLDFQHHFNQTSDRCVSCDVETTVFSTAPWSITDCGDWVLERESVNVLHNCVREYYRQVEETRIRNTVRQEADCSLTVCQQTQFQFSTWYSSCYVTAAETLPPGGTCQGTSPCTPPDSSCQRGDDEQKSSWVPYLCPWEI